VSDLLRTALLGTGQVPTAHDSTGTAADALVDALQLTERERALLLRAGAEAVLRRAGARAVAFTGQLASSAPEARPRPSARVCRLVEQVFGGEHGDLLAEVMGALDRAGLRLPEELLPRALDERSRENRRCLRPVLGERGKWLARQRAEWRWASEGEEDELPALPADADSRWLEGTTEERGYLLRWARKCEPARARAWVTSTFKSDKPEQRTLWLATLELGITPEDVPLLESALGDRSAQVRRAAARLLWLLRDGESSRALRRRVEAVFPEKAPPTGVLGKVKAALSSGVELHVVLPAEEWDKSLERLGLEETPPGPKVGRRQWWLAQHVAATPPAWFTERYRCTASELLQAARGHDYEAALLNGWTSASLRFGATDWLGALWDAWLGSKERGDWFGLDPLFALTKTMAPDERFSRLLSCVRAGDRLDLLGRYEGQWPDALARAVLGRLRTESAGGRQLVALAASRLPLELAPAALSSIEGTSPGYARLLDELNAKLDFRRLLAEELRR
jgi:Family of unknown function (DUF5691)